MDKLSVVGFPVDRLFIRCGSVLDQQNAAGIQLVDVGNNVEICGHANGSADAMICCKTYDNKSCDLPFANGIFEVGADEAGVDTFGENWLVGSRGCVRLEGDVSADRV